MITPQFVQVLQDSFVDSVTIVGYGQKAPIAYGQKLMQAAGEGDGCVIIITSFLVAGGQFSPLGSAELPISAT
jgi:hypothetical protein